MELNLSLQMQSNIFQIALKTDGSGVSDLKVNV